MFRRKAKTRHVRHAAYFRPKAHRKSGSGVMGRMLQVDWKRKIMAFLYGGFRGQISARNPLNNMLGGFGQYSDEAGMIIVTQVLKTLVPQAKEIAEVGQDIEFAMIGSQTLGNLGISSGNNNSVF
jgi:hypothetical protein